MTAIRTPRNPCPGRLESWSPTVTDSRRFRTNRERRLPTCRGKAAGFANPTVSASTPTPLRLRIEPLRAQSASSGEPPEPSARPRARHGCRRRRLRCPQVADCTCDALLVLWGTVIEAVVFDVDGVLVRSGAFGQQLRRELGVPSNELDEFWRGPFARCSLGLADLKQEVEPYLRRWGYPGSLEGCLRDWFEADSTINSHVLDEVDRLRRRGVPCHIASTQEHYRAAYLADTMGFGQAVRSLIFLLPPGSEKAAARVLRAYRVGTRHIAGHPAFAR